MTIIWLYLTVFYEIPGIINPRHFIIARGLPRVIMGCQGLISLVFHRKLLNKAISNRNLTFNIKKIVDFTQTSVRKS